MLTDNNYVMDATMALVSQLRAALKDSERRASDNHAAFYSMCLHMEALAAEADRKAAAYGEDQYSLGYQNCAAKLAKSAHRYVKYSKEYTNA